MKLIFNYNLEKLRKISDMTYLMLLHSKSSQFLVIQLSSKHWFCRLQEPEFRYGACLPPSVQNRIKTEFWKPCGWLLIYPALLLWNPNVMFKNTIKLGKDGSSNLGRSWENKPWPSFSDSKKTREVCSEKCVLRKPPRPWTPYPPPSHHFW